MSVVGKGARPLCNTGFLTIKRDHKERVILKPNKFKINKACFVSAVTFFLLFPNSSFSSTVIKLSIEDMARASGCIVRGRVGTVAMIPHQGTRVTQKQLMREVAAFEVTEPSWKCRVDGRSLQVVAGDILKVATMRGRVQGSDVAMKVHGAAELKQGDEMVLFLEAVQKNDVDYKNWIWLPTTLAQGAFHVTEHRGQRHVTRQRMDINTVTPRSHLTKNHSHHGSESTTEAIGMEQFKTKVVDALK